MSEVAEVREVPRYQVRERCFIEPYLVQPGSIIETEGHPGPHLVPLNAAAEARWEAWLKEEVPHRDDDGKLTGKTHTPHEKYRFLTPKGGPSEPPPQVTILAGPPKQHVGVENTLAGKHLQRKLGEMRPPPAPFSEVPSDGMTVGEVVIAHAAPKPKVR